MIQNRRPPQARWAQTLEKGRCAAGHADSLIVSLVCAVERGIAAAAARHAVTPRGPLGGQQLTGCGRRQSPERHAELDGVAVQHAYAQLQLLGWWRRRCSGLLRRWRGCGIVVLSLPRRRLRWNSHGRDVPGRRSWHRSRCPDRAGLSRVAGLQRLAEGRLRLAKCAAAHRCRYG